MKKKFSLSLIMITLCTSIFIGGCSCGKDGGSGGSSEPQKPVNPNANVILATDIQLSNSLITDAMVGTPIEITYVINPSNTTDKTMIIESSDTSVAKIYRNDEVSAQDESGETEGTEDPEVGTDDSEETEEPELNGALEVTGKLTETITVVPVGVGTVNIVFTWNGFFDNDVESENRTLTKATKIHVVGEYGKETLSTPTGLNYANGKFTWNKVAYGTDGIEAEPIYELELTGGAAPLASITLDTNEYAELPLTAGVEYTARVKAKPSDDLQYFYAASAYSEPISIYKLGTVDTMDVENGVVTWDVVNKANKYIVNVNGVDVDTITPVTDATQVTFDAKDYLVDDVTEVTVKVKAICDNDPLVFNGEYSVNNVTINQIGITENYTLTNNADGTAILAWNSVAHATNYIVEIYKDGVVDAIVTETITTNSYVLDNTYLDSYKIRVKAIGNEYTLSGEFSDYYEFSKQNIAELTATLVDGVVEFSIVDSHDCDVVFYAIDNTNTIKTKSFNVLSGSFEVAELTTSNSYIVYARLEPRSTSNMLTSEIVRVGYGSKIEFEQNADYTAEITWDRLDSAENYTIEFTKGGVSVLTETVENNESGKVTFNIPETLASGNYEVKVTINTGSVDLYAGESNVETFTKVDVNSLQTTFNNNVLDITTTDANIVKVLVTVTGPENETFEETLPATIDFAIRGYESGTYTVSIRALADIESKYISGDSKDVTDAIINVITNPEVLSVSVDGLITWSTDETYATYNVYVDKGTDDEILEEGLTSNTKQLFVTGLANGEHTVYVVAVPKTGYLPSLVYTEFTFTKLSTVTGIKYEDGKIVWDAVEGAGQYEVLHNGTVKDVTDLTEYTPDPADIRDSNEFAIRPLGNGTNTISSENPTAETIDRVAAVTDLGVYDGKLAWTEQSGVTYKAYVNDVEIEDLTTHTFAGLAPDTYAKIHIYGFKEGMFDSNISNIFYIKKLAKVDGIKVTSSDKITYTIEFNKVTGADLYSVVYNGNAYNISGSANKVTVVGTLPGGDYTVTVQAISNDSEPNIDGDKYWQYINGDASDEKSFTKLHIPGNVSVQTGQLIWTDASTSVDYYEIKYVKESDKDSPEKWKTQTVTAGINVSSMSFITDAGSYIVQIRGMSNSDDVLTSDYTDQLIITKVPKVDNLKVLFGEITWDSVVSDDNAYVYDIYVYTIVDGKEEPHGELVTDYTGTTYTIPNMVPEEEYYIKVKAKNSLGIEIPGEYTAALKVIKLISPVVFNVADNVLYWSAASYADAKYTIQFTNLTEESEEISTHYQVEAGLTTFAIPDDLLERVLYSVKIMVKGTEDSGELNEDPTLPITVGYINSDYSTALDIFKLAAIANLRVENGIIKWQTSHSLNDEGKPVDYFIVLYKDGDTINSSRDFVLTTLNQTSLDLGDIEAGNYMIEFYVRGNGTNVLNSKVQILGDSSPIRKLATPTDLHMQNGNLVWSSADGLPEIIYELYNGSSTTPFMEKDASSLSFCPEIAPAGTEYNISIRAKMEGALYSGQSESIKIYKLASVTGFTLENGYFTWDPVPNATGYMVTISYWDVVYEEDGVTPKVDEETGETIKEKITMSFSPPGGASISYAWLQLIAVEYSIDSITAIGNTTSMLSQVGYFTAKPTQLEGTFSPLANLTGLTVQGGEFVWDAVQGAGYYTIKILDSENNVVKSDSTPTTRYRVVDVPAGEYTIKVTPIAASVNYVTTNIATEAKFTKLSELSGFRIENGYVAWNVSKNEILKSYNAAMGGTVQETPPDKNEPAIIPADPEGGDEVGGEGEEENPNIKKEFDNEVFNAFYRVAIGPLADDYLANSLYSLAYCQLEMYSADNSKVVRKIVQPIHVVDDNDDYVTCYYFVDVEEDTWNIRLCAKGNSIHKDDQASIKYVDGVMPTTAITARKLTKPVTPIHPNKTMIVDGYLTFTPVVGHNNVVYAKYLIEAVPSTSPNDRTILYEYTVNTADLYESQAIDVKLLGLKEDVLYNLSVRALGSTGNTGELWLNSDTPATTALTILGRLSISVVNGQLTWAQSTADKFEFVLTDLTGANPIVEKHDLDPNTTTFSMGELDAEGQPIYNPGQYIATIQAIGNGKTKISSNVSVEFLFEKLGEIPSIQLSNGEFVWTNLNKNAGQNGYEVTIYRTREGLETPENTGTTTLPHNGTDEVIRFALPDNLESNVVVDGDTCAWEYSLAVKMLGSVAGSYVTGDVSEESLGYKRLTAPRNIKVSRDQISWNKVSGASGYKVYISGVASTKEIYLNGASTYTLDHTFVSGTYKIQVRAIATTATGFINSPLSASVVVVRVAEPELRIERGELYWNSVEELPFEATRYVRITIDGVSTDISNVDNNITFDFDNANYPAGPYFVEVQFIGDGEYIVVDPALPEEDESESEPVAPVADVVAEGFYYLSSEPAHIEFSKLYTPEISLGKVDVDESEEVEDLVNAILWNPILGASSYDVYVKTETIVTPDDETTEIDEQVVETTIDRYTIEENSDLFGETEGGLVYFKLSNIPYDDYKIYIRAVGNTYPGEAHGIVSSTRSNEIHVHIPIAPVNFKYNQNTGLITWTNVTESSNIVLEVMKMDNMGEYSIEVYEGGIELPAGTSSFQLEEIGQYQLRIKARLVITGGSYDSDFSDTVLNINFNMFLSGAGSEFNPYVIGDDLINSISAEKQLDNIRYFMDRHFVLSQNVQLNTYSNWTPIGSESKPFTGVINGAGYTISGINYTNQTYSTVAFVNTLGVPTNNANANTINATAMVKNVNFVVAIEREYGVTAQNFAGIVATNYATIDGCTITGDIVVDTSSNAGNTYAGAVYRNFGTIKNVISSLNITTNKFDNTTSYAKVGGIAAENYNLITACGNSGNLSGQIVGGIVADNYAEIKLSYNKGSISVATNKYSGNICAGGIAARNNDDMNNLSNKPTGIIDTCYVLITSGAKISVTNGGSKPAYVGGLVGSIATSAMGLFKNNYVVLNNAYQGEGSNIKAGGLAGLTSNSGSTNYQVFENCYVQSTLVNVMNYGTSTISADSVTSNAGKYSNNIVVVTNPAGETINISGISCTQENNYLPKLDWEE